MHFKMILTWSAIALQRIFPAASPRLFLAILIVWIWLGGSCARTSRPCRTKREEAEEAEEEAEEEEEEEEDV
eukprot:COSAG06_NODE_254_length_19039_cov_5.465488_4_plen_72_part_00